MKKLIRFGLIGLLFCLLLVNVAGASLTATLYATSDEARIGYFAYFHLAPTETENGIDVTTDFIEVYSFYYSHIIQLSEIHPKINAIVPATWTVTYYGSSNVSDESQFCIMFAVLTEEQKLAWVEWEEPIPLEFWELAGLESKYQTADYTALSDFIQDTNQSLIGTTTLEETIEVDPTDYLYVEWGYNKTDTTLETISLYFDAQSSPVHPTMIEGFEYSIEIWSGALSPIWYILLPILFLVGVSIYFIKTERKPDVKEIIEIAVAFVILTILIPIALNSLYAA